MALTNDKMAYLALVIHTEPPLDATGKSLPMIARISHSHKMPVTWVVTQDVAINFGNSNCELSKVYGFSLKDSCTGTYDVSGIRDEVGAHLHPETFFGVKYKRFKGGITSIDNYAVNRLSEREQDELMKKLTDAISTCVGIRPKTFVAGRWAESEDGTTLRILEKLGYTVDINLPFYKPVGKSDWTGARYYQPYHPSRENVLRLGDSNVLLIPQTVLPPRISMSPRSLIFTNNKVLWPYSEKKPIENIFDYYYSLREDWSPVGVVIYMHSSDGGTKDVLQRLDWLLNYASHKANVAFVTAQEYAEAFSKEYGGKNPEKVYSIPSCTAFLARASRSLRIARVLSYIKEDLDE